MLLLLLSACAHKQTSILATLFGSCHESSFLLCFVAAVVLVPLERLRSLSSPSRAAHLSEQLMAGEGESVAAESRLGRAPMGKFGDVSSPSFPRSFSSFLTDEAKQRGGKWSFLQKFPG